MKNKKVHVIILLIMLLTIVCLESGIVDIKSLATATTLKEPADNKAYYSNTSDNYLSTSAADPTIIKGNDGCLYVFATNSTAYRSCDSKIWSSWNYSFNKSLPSHNYFWAPEVHKIGNYYYMFFTLVTWGSDYPWSSDSLGSVYYARSTDLKNFEYLGEMPYGSNYFNGRVNNKNHIDGSLLQDNGKYYFYYKLENKDIPNDYQGQEIYGIEVGLNSNGQFYEISNPKIVMRKNTESNPIESNNFTWHSWQDGNYAGDIENINEGPYVIKKGNKYYLTYSVGEYTNDSYHVVVATSNNPLGQFIRDKMSTTNSINENQPNIRDFISGDNYPNTANTDTSRNSNINIYGTGHGSILTITNHDSLVGNYTEYYYAYHSNKYKNGTFIDRKLTIDGVNFKDGVMFVNGPTTEFQPLISGSSLNGVYYYKIPTNKYSINSNILSDGLKSSAKNMNFATYDTDTLNISFTNNERVSLSDIWIYSDGSNFSNVKGTLYINEGTGNDYKMSFVANISKGTGKIQIPDINEKVKNIRIVFDKKIRLSEVELIRNTLTNYYQVKFDNGNSPILMIYSSSTNNKVTIPTKIGYNFLGWYTDTGVLVYDANGNFNKSASTYWNGNGAWIYKNDLSLTAKWEKISIIDSLPVIPNETSTPSPTSSPKPTSTPTVTSTPTNTPKVTSVPKATTNPVESSEPVIEPDPETIVTQPKKQGLIEYLLSSPLTIGVTIAVAIFFAAGVYTVVDYNIKRK